MLKIALTVNAGSYKFVGKKEGRGMKYGEGLHCRLGACQARSFPAAPAPCSGQGWEKTERRTGKAPELAETSKHLGEGSPATGTMNKTGGSSGTEGCPQKHASN